ncbi:MAG: hypothetical protein E7177_05530 [Erysipelotrichaceae bacterium]|nr:hypothetical protein [Erysipelotrichaceae bacterium]
MKKIILSLSILSSILSISSNVKRAKAETIEVEYTNSAYQICEVQSTLNNYFLGDSIYNSGTGTIRLKNSLRIKNPESKKLTFYFEFEEDISSYEIEPFGDFYFTMMDDENNYIFSFAEQFQTADEIKGIIERDDKIHYYSIDNTIYIEVDTSSLPEYLNIYGDEHESNYDFLKINFIEKATIQRFALSPTSYEDFEYTAPSLGLGAESDEVYSDGDALSYIINYDNRLSLEEIKQDIIAYDYHDNIQITPTVELDEYTPAINQNKLGTFSVKLKATDASNNSSTISLHFTIEDTTNPVFVGEKSIEIDYNDLPENKLLDLTQYIYAEDNHDGVIHLDDSFKTYNPKLFTSEEIPVTFTDESGNSISETITLTITDTNAPIIEGDDEIEIYQYQFSAVSDLLSLFTIEDNESGIKRKYIESNIRDLAKAGTYQIKVNAIDNSQNQTTKNVTLKIKDGVGPVFFINVQSLTLSNEEYQSAEQVISQLMENGSIKRMKYKKCEYITKDYESNYNKLGSYDTQIVCFDEEGNRDFYLVKINVKYSQGSNFFTRFYSSMINFFKTLWEHIKTLFYKIVNFFKQ